METVWKILGEESKKRRTKAASGELTSGHSGGSCRSWGRDPRATMVIRRSSLRSCVYEIKREFSGTIDKRKKTNLHPQMGPFETRSRTASRQDCRYLPLMSM